jgi:hypothetical protein
MDSQLRALIRQGDRAARLGKTQAAEDVYRQAVDLFPDAPQAWLGLSQVAPTETERAAAYRRARQLDPSLPPAGGADGKEPAESPSSQLDAALAASQSWLNETAAAPSSPPARPPKRAPRVEPAPSVEEEEVATTCFYHPNRTTTLRCNRCDKAICTRCAIKTPVGYRCKECIKEQQAGFYTAQWFDYLLAAVVALPLAVIAGYIVPSIGWLTIFVAPFAGVVIAEAVRLVIRRRRGRWMALLVAGAIVVGGLPLLIGGLLQLAVWSLIWRVVYLVLAVSSAYYRIK